MILFDWLIDWLIVPWMAVLTDLITVQHEHTDRPAPISAILCRPADLTHPCMKSSCFLEIVGIRESLIVRPVSVHWPTDSDVDQQVSTVRCRCPQHSVSHSYNTCTAVLSSCSLCCEWNWLDHVTTISESANIGWRRDRIAYLVAGIRNSNAGCWPLRWEGTSRV